MHKTFSYLIIGIVGVFVSIMPQNVNAAELKFSVLPNNVSNNGKTIVEVRIDPQSRNLNLVEGVIAFQGAISDKLSADIENGGSVLTLWTTPPQYYQHEKVIRFAGGVPGGFDHEGLLFRIILSSSVSGNSTISWIGGTAYRNDGKGTKEIIVARSISVNLDKINLETADNVLIDITPPKFDFVEIGRDSSIYGGKYFISFHANDDISGVSRYEVKEGQSITTVTNGIYLLKDQERKENITITAYDKAGNNRTINVSTRYDWVMKVLILLVVIIVLLIIFWYVYKRVSRR